MVRDRRRKALCWWCLREVDRSKLPPDEPGTVCHRLECQELEDAEQEFRRNPPRDEDDPSVWPDGRNRAGG